MSFLKRIHGYVESAREQENALTAWPFDEEVSSASKPVVCSLLSKATCMGLNQVFLAVGQEFSVTFQVNLCLL